MRLIGSILLLLSATATAADGPMSDDERAFRATATAALLPDLVLRADTYGVFCVALGDERLTARRLADLQTLTPRPIALAEACSCTLDEGCVAVSNGEPACRGDIDFRYSPKGPSQATIASRCRAMTGFAATAVFQATKGVWRFDQYQDGAAKE